MAMAANKYVISRQAEIDGATVERALAVLRTARQEVSGWEAVTMDAEARKALADVANGLADLESDLRGSTEHVTERDPEEAA
jgi:uncharacterized membrane protein